MAEGSGSPTSAQRGIQQQERDILHIKKGDLELKTAHDFMVEHFNYWLWYIVPILILAGVLFYYRKSLKARSDLKLMKTKRANKVAKKRLRVAQQFMRAGDSNKFYADT